MSAALRPRSARWPATSPRDDRAGLGRRQGRGFVGILQRRGENHGRIRRGRAWGTLPAVVLGVPAAWTPAPAAETLFRAGAAASGITPVDRPVILNGGMSERQSDQITDNPSTHLSRNLATAARAGVSPPPG